MLRFNDEIVEGGVDPLTSPNQTPGMNPPAVALADGVVKPVPYTEEENAALRAAFASKDSRQVSAAHAKIQAARTSPAGPEAMVRQEVTDTTDYIAEDRANFELIDRTALPWDRQATEVLARFGDDKDAGCAALDDMWEAGEQNVLAKLYRGSEHALAAGVAEINEALGKVENGQSMVDWLNHSRGLADLRTHQQMLSLARQINRRSAR